MEKIFFLNAVQLYFLNKKFRDGVFGVVEREQEIQRPHRHELRILIPQKIGPAFGLELLMIVPDWLALSAQQSAGTTFQRTSVSNAGGTVNFTGTPFNAIYVVPNDKLQIMATCLQSGNLPVCAAANSLIYSFGTI